MMSEPGVEIRIAFLICYLQSLYEIEPTKTKKNIFVDAENLCKQMQ